MRLRGSHPVESSTQQLGDWELQSPAPARSKREKRKRTEGIKSEVNVRVCERERESKREYTNLNKIKAFRRVLFRPGSERGEQRTVQQLGHLPLQFLEMRAAFPLKDRSDEM